MNLLDKARILDQNDPLADFKHKFALPENTIYLDGNSLGPLPRKTTEILAETIHQQWGNRLIRSWNENWLESQHRISQKIAHLIGAKPNEVWVTDSTSVNLFKLAHACLKKAGNRKKVITDSLNFPGDGYVLQKLVTESAQKYQLKTVDIEHSENAENLILDSLDEDTALLSLSHVTYQAAFRYSMHRINKKANQLGIPVIWDLSHSVGAIHMDVKESLTKLAVGCTYKYLNGGPGAPSFIYISEELQNELESPIGGWFSHQNPFAFDQKLELTQGIMRFAVGTPSVLSLKAIEAGVDIYLEAGSRNLETKSVALFNYFMELYELFLKPLGFGNYTPIDNDQRGSHIALSHNEAYRINLSLINPRISVKEIITDHRPPDILRLALTPLYLGFEELYETAKRLEYIVKEHEFEHHSPVQSGVI